MLDQTASSSNEQNSTTVASMSTSIPFAATTQSNNVPAQIVQVYERFLCFDFFVFRFLSIFL